MAIRPDPSPAIPPFPMLPVSAMATKRQQILHKIEEVQRNHEILGQEIIAILKLYDEQKVRLKALVDAQAAYISASEKNNR